MVAEALASIPLPPGVRLVRFFFDTDHTGDPAVMVVYGLSRKFPFTKARGRELSELSVATVKAVFAAGVDRFAYTSFENVR